MKKILLLFVGILLIGVVSIKASELISSSQVLYKDNNTVATALDELFSAVDINERLGDADISNISDGTVTGAINEINNKTKLEALQNELIKDNIIIQNFMDYEEIIIKSYFYNGWCNTMHIYPKFEEIISNGNGTNFMLSSSSTVATTTIAYSYASIDISSGELGVDNQTYINGTINESYYLGYKVFARK